MPRSDSRQHSIAVSAALLVTFLWSSSWVLIRVGLDDESLRPVSFAGLRYGAAAVVLGAWVATRPRHRAELRRLGRRDLGLLAVLGLVFYALTQGAQFVAIDHQPAATTSLVLSLTPIAVALTGGRSLAEHSSPRQVSGGVLVAAGAGIYFGGDLGATAIGMTAAVIGLAANVASSLLGRLANRDARLSPTIVTTVSMSIGAAVLIVAGLAAEGVPEVSERAALIVLWLAVVNTAFAFTLWNVSMRRLAAVESAGINNTMLIQIAVLAWIFLDEPPGPLGAAGVLIVSVGVFLTQATRRTAGTPSR
ncbi:MAG: DMT family transporter [Ilumatobacter sp.]|uniref:DMT family transporter n=1 Tax=Ilumatobacter sp. TaxID=1967498 RepID=UPI00260BB5BC|nr:DMT family transporter [Ilumatobacter sp.]MDJ0769015.1 DMT family transporter [Ilumatobacter sp.]